VKKVWDWCKREVVLCIAIVLAVVSAFLLIIGIVQKTPLMIVLAIAYPGLMLFSQKISVEKSYKNTQSMHDAQIDYQFYEDHFVKIFSEKEERYEYKNLHKILETETNFYLMLNKTQGFVLVKDNMPEGLSDFLKNGIK
jgi:hypothetical protein